MARKSLGGDPQFVHYFAVPPTAFGELTKALGKHDLARGARVVYEKPFGTSPQSFRTLDRTVHAVLTEDQVYRIDHFLGKEATQDLHVLRFANEVFSGIWNHRHIESVQIDVVEKLGITDRSVFYDATGAVLDMLITHLFQVAAEVAMEPPASLDAADLQSAREKVIKSFRRIDPAEVVLGQFAGDRDVPGVAPKSQQNTFVAARLWIDNARWRGVPFYLRTGKRLAETKQRVSVILRKPADGPLAGMLPAEPNVLSFSLAGDGEIDLTVVAKRPGAGLSLDVATAMIPLSKLEDADPLPAYVRLIHDVLLGDRSLFTRPDGLAAAWKVAEPLLTDPPKVVPTRRARGDRRQRARSSRRAGGYSASSRLTPAWEPSRGWSGEQNQPGRRRRSVHELTVVEICAGAGGQALGLEQAGFSHAAAVELDADACETLRRNRGDDWKIIEDDVANLDGHAFTGIDLVAGGVPCPPFSVAGKQLGRDDERDLFPQALRLVAEIRPRAVLLENVRGLGTGKFAAYRAHVLGRLAELGYHACWQLIHASDHGVPQLRPRFVLVAVASPWAASFRWPTPRPGTPPTVGETLADLMDSAGLAGRGRLGRARRPDRAHDRRRQQEAWRTGSRPDQGPCCLACARRGWARHRRRPARPRLPA